MGDARKKVVHRRHQHSQDPAPGFPGFPTVRLTNNCRNWDIVNDIVFLLLLKLRELCSRSQVLSVVRPLRRGESQIQFRALRGLSTQICTHAELLCDPWFPLRFNVDNSK